MKILRMIACNTYSTGLLWIFLLASSMSHAVTYFEQCDSALKKPSFHLLAQYLDAHNGLLDQDDDESQPDICFQLNNHEFLVIAATLGRSSNYSDGTYLCDLNQKQWARRGRDSQRQCESSDTTSGLGQPSVVSEFDDGMGKHFVLFESETIESRSVIAQSYAVFHLTKPNEATHGLPFSTQNLVSAENYGVDWGDDSKDNPNDGLCPLIGSDSNNGQQDNIDKYVIGQDTAGHADLKFNITQEDCHTHKIKQYTREFVFKQGKFQEVKAGSVKINKQSTPAAS